jgi:hypothetical protein
LNICPQVHDILLQVASNFQLSGQSNKLQSPCYAAPQ